MTRSLTVIPTHSTPAARAQSLHDQAARAAQDHVSELRAAMDETRRLADEVGSGSTLYPAGIRDLARRLALHLGHVGDTMGVVR